MTELPEQDWDFEPVKSAYLCNIAVRYDGNFEINDKHQGNHFCGDYDIYIFSSILEI